MKKPNLRKIATTVRIGLRRHSPEILTGFGIAGMLTTTIMAVRATPKAIFIINEEECRRSKLGGTDKVSSREMIVLTWQCYIPASVVGILSTTCLICASSVNSKRNTALATAYSISESVLKEYQEKVIETIGEKKEQSIRDEVAKDQMSRTPVNNQNVIITNKGDTLCFDVLSGRYFKNDIDKLRRVENDMYRKMLDERYVSLNDFYYEIGLEGIDVGNELGWNIDDGPFELYFTSNLTPDGVPCVVVNYRVSPKNNYYK